MGNRSEPVPQTLIEEIKHCPQLWSAILDSELESKKMDDLAQGCGEDWKMAPDEFPAFSQPAQEQLISDFVEQWLGRKDPKLAERVTVAIRLLARHALRLDGPDEKRFS